ncbi:MAG: hypothetical protein ACC628_14585 [Pirellulaceae bacterium]
MIKKFLMLSLSAALAISLSTQQAAADKDAENAAAALILLGLIGASVAHDQKKRENNQYRPSRDLSPKENAVGACMLRTKQLVEQAGGNRAKLNNVRSIVKKPNGRFVLDYDATGYYDLGLKRSRIRCVVERNRVVKFTHS